MVPSSRCGWGLCEPCHSDPYGEFEPLLVGLHVPNCELFAGRSRYRERASRRWLAPLRASGPPGWRLVHSVKGGPVSPTADGEDTPYFRRCAPAKTRPDVAVSPEHWPSPSRSADAAQVCREGRLRSAQGAVLHVGPSANAPPPPPPDFCFG